MTLLRIDASIRFEGSVSRGLADIAERAWVEAHPGGEIVRREIGTRPLPSSAWSDATSAGGTSPEDQTPAQLEAIALAAALADEVVSADAVIVAAPLYNFGVSQHVKIWLDLLLTDPRLRPGGEPPLPGRPLILAVARGGGYGEGTPRAGWDHATPWYVRMFADVLGMDVHLTQAELTLASVTPGMEPLIELAEKSRQDAAVIAAEHGAAVARKVAERAAA